MDSDERLDPHRRQHRRRARRGLRRRDGRRLVSDHAVDVADGGVQGVLRALPHGRGDGTQQVLHPAGRGRAGGRGHRDRRGLGGRALVHDHLGPGHLADAGVHRASPTTPRSRRSSSTCSAPGPSTGMPTRTQQADLLSIAYASHGDTKHIIALPGESRGVLLPAPWRRSTSPSGSRRPCSWRRDLDIGMNDWMCKRLAVGRQLRAGPRQGARRRRAGEGQEVLALPRRRRRRHRRAHAARRGRQGRVLRARLRARQARRVHRGLRRVPGGGRPPRAEVRDGRAGRARAGDPCASRAPTIGIVTHRRVPRRGARGDRPAARAGHRRRLHAHQGVPVRLPRCSEFLDSHGTTSSSSRTATRSCARC